MSPLLSYRSLGVLAVSGLLLTPVRALTEDGTDDSQFDLSFMDASLEDQSDFLPGVVELRLRLAQVGTSVMPWSLLTSFVGWSEITFGVEIGVLKRNDLVLGLGVEPWLATAALPSLLAGASWSATERGVALRGNVHFTQFSSVDAWIGGLAGPTFTELKVNRAVNDVNADGQLNIQGLRVGAAAGVSTVTRANLVFGAELRYLAGFRFGDQTFGLTSREGDTLDEHTPSPVQRSPRGFSWSFHAGVRF